VLQALGRNGVADLIRGHCQLARYLATTLAGEPGITVMNEVALNQLAIVFEDPTSTTDADTLTGRVAAEIRRENTSFVEQAEWKGRRILRVSIISADTRQEHVDRLAASIIRAWRHVREKPGPG
jgi:glutamate/tyrosine decarboxylase-like PLP-dependent enzyme